MSKGRDSGSSSAASSTAENVLVTVVQTTVEVAIMLCIARLGYKLYDFASESGREASRNVAKLKAQLARNQRKSFTMSSYEQQIAGDLIDPTELKVTFDAIGGLEKQKQELHDLVILPLRRPELFTSRSSLMSTPKGILLYGPPGTGKTLLAKAIAKESGAYFINLKMGTIMSKWQGESEKLIAATFSLARKLSPCVIFVDEVDNFMGSRGSSGSESNVKALKTEFMIHWDGFVEQAAGSFGVVVLGATNRPGDVDSAFLRRMPRTFEVGLPSKSQRQNILSIQLAGETLDRDVSLPKLAAATKGYSGSDLTELCRAAVLIPLREVSRSSESTTLRHLRYSDFEEAMTQVRATGESAKEYAAANGQQRFNMPQSSSVDREMLAAAMMTGVQLGMAQAASQGGSFRN